MIIAIAADHGGFALKEAVGKHLKEKGYEVLDLGTHSEESVDYPIYGHACAEVVSKGQAARGIVVCGTGIGMSITANKVPGIRCAVCSECFSAVLSRSHNDANMLALGARVVGPGLARMIVTQWLEAGFEGGRHQQRVDMMTAIEKERPAL